MPMITRFEDALCGCCRRTATGLGHTPKFGEPIIWVCDNAECHQVVKNTYKLPQEEFTRSESRAAVKGGEAGGAYLDEIGQFSRRVVAGYRVALLEELKDAIPF
jgi:hypothetical protein